MLTYTYDTVCVDNVYILASYGLRCLSKQHILSHHNHKLGFLWRFYMTDLHTLVNTYRLICVKYHMNKYIYIW